MRKFQEYPRHSDHLKLSARNSQEVEIVETWTKYNLKHSNPLLIRLIKLNKINLISEYTKYILQNHVDLNLNFVIMLK